MSLLCPCSSSWADRQPGKALLRPPAQALWLAGPPGVTRTAHFISAQLGRFPAGNWADTPASVVGQSWLISHDFGRCQGKKGPGCWDLSMLSEAVATVAQSGTS